MTSNTTKSIEPLIAELGNSWLKKYGIDYKLEGDDLNLEIRRAFEEYFSKSGKMGGGNRPDSKFLLQDPHSGKYYPVVVEYKGHKDKLIKLDEHGNIDNQETKGSISKNISQYAVNGAVHYANAILHYTSYTDIIAIGMTGYRDLAGNVHHEIGVYLVNKSNYGVGKKISEYTDFSFLATPNRPEFFHKISQLKLTPEELEKARQNREKAIDKSLIKLNNDIYNNEQGIGENDRVYLVAATIMATLGVEGKVSPLSKDELISSSEHGNRDGDIILRKIKAFLQARQLPESKKDLILRTLSNLLENDNLNKVSNNETQIKRIFSKVVDELGIHYRMGISTDFTGKLFNEMYSWLGFSQDKLNDVVLTPSYVATLLVKLARVNRDSYVWDFATGSAGLLVAAMNEMLNDARSNIHSPEELRLKEAKIKAEQLLGLELLSNVYMLAVLNMILMGDGSTNIINADSIKDFDGKYGYGRTEQDFPADAFILNPPYSATGNGMIFVKKALDMMQGGYAAIIIQSTAGSGKAAEINRDLLQRHSLIASIKMPNDLFRGKSMVQTHIYVFKVKQKHDAKQIVKFIDFSEDGYTRTARKKSSVNLRDTNHAKERYAELVELVHYGRKYLHFIDESCYYENTIDPNNGEDWNQAAPKEEKANFAQFQKTIGNYYSWQASRLLEEQNNLGNLDSNRFTDNNLDSSFHSSSANQLNQSSQFNQSNQLNQEQSFTTFSTNSPQVAGSSQATSRLQLESNAQATTSLQLENTQQNLSPLAILKQLQEEKVQGEQKLQAMLEGVQWRGFTVKQLFDVKGSRAIFNANAVTIHEQKVPASYPYVVRQEGNNGIKGYIVEDEQYLNPGNTLSFANDTFLVFYQKQPYFTGNRIVVLHPTFVEANENTLKFIATEIQHEIDGLTWGTSFPRDKLLNMVIKLPVTSQGTIDYAFMEKYIEEVKLNQLKELKGKYLAELQAFMAVTGISSY
ncbi:hypothetical protein CKF54_07205 [Psittacicella hinzii]|uniref:site-specific DNA-methyltransferase (adenine-specific) n=1 Tax=Psittacicella hinzii TaxID=2028575 RepID=A0A3A1Y1P7_9GAMM|nr:N-6 DNA methylase [Psittacicella hinzii]RIY31206.1 hypothetical protein CKF54_07205 [Psittacicella hinzii]